MGGNGRAYPGMQRPPVPHKWQNDEVGNHHNLTEEEKWQLPTGDKVGGDGWIKVYSVFMKDILIINIEQSIFEERQEHTIVAENVGI